MAVGTNQPKILEPVVVASAVDVVKLGRDRLPVPFRSSAVLTSRLLEAFS